MIRYYIRKMYRTLMPLIYSKRNFKLFVHDYTFKIFAEHERAILSYCNMFPSLITPIPMKAPFGKSMLVVAPHHDDEIIGCGGGILLQVQKRKKVSVVFVQDGGNEHLSFGMSRDKLVKIRERESLEVAKEIGIDKPRFLRHIMPCDEDVNDLSYDLYDEINRVEADAIFTPFMLDYDIDHQRTNYALAKALSRLNRHPRIFGYEVWGLTIPNIIVKIDNVMDEKIRLLKLYRSQLSGKDYVRGVTGLNMYHSLLMGAGESKFVERYFEVPSPDFIAVMNEIKAQRRSLK